jgi:tripartite-type tricarboxylate transporter receptor subunit TctC
MGIDWTCGAWRGIAAPAGTPPEIVAVLEKAIETVVKSDEFIKFMKNRGYGIYWLKSADFAKALAQADKDNGEIMKAAGIAK